jgi:hypothetical protein
MFLTAAAEEPVDYNNALEEPEAKRQKCDADIRQPASPFEPGKETQAETTDTWGTNGDGDWGAAAQGWARRWSTKTRHGAHWELTTPESLFSLLGPTALPLTHLPGIVERSMRRIATITRPPSSVAKSPPLPEGVYEPNAWAVEIELERRFAMVVLTPMIDWDGGDSPSYTKPVDTDFPAALFPRGLNQSTDRLQSNLSSFRLSPSTNGSPSGPNISFTPTPSLISHVSFVSLKRVPRSRIASIPGRLRKDALNASKSWRRKGRIGARIILRSPSIFWTTNFVSLAPQGIALGYRLRLQCAGSCFAVSTG